MVTWYRRSPAQPGTGIAASHPITPAQRPWRCDPSGGEDFRTVLEDGDGMLEVGREAFIGCDHRPLIILEPCVRAAYIHHWLNSYCHTLPEQSASTTRAIVGDLGVLMEEPANAMPDVLTDDAVPTSLRKPLYCIPYVSHPRACPGSFDTLLKGKARNFDEVCGLWAYVAHSNGDGGVAYDAVNNGSHVHFD